MIWQLLAMWLIVVVTIVWFVRDEQRRSSDIKLGLQALRFVATPHYRGGYREPKVAPPPLRRPTLSAADRTFLEDFINKVRTGA